MAHGLDIGPDGLRLASGDPADPRLTCEPAVKCVADGAALRTAGVDPADGCSHTGGLVGRNGGQIGVAEVTNYATGPCFADAALGCRRGSPLQPRRNPPRRRRGPGLCHDPRLSRRTHRGLARTN
ncbi:MAG: hypothetical protein U5K37_05775 [Natrialbaceae archaeon]|nr:hypothetical protein [Natrialbaceae archaeon]